MRHRNKVNKLNRAKTERVSLLRNLLKSIIKHETIHTTELRYKAVKAAFDRLLNTAKKGDVNSMRRIYAVLRDESLTKKIMEDIAKRYESKKSGYLISYKLENRKGDNAKMVRIELSK